MDTKNLKKHLNKVILKLDFVAPIKAIDESVPFELNKILISNFPITEPRDIIAQELQISTDSLSRKKTSAKEWRYYDKNRKNLFCITNNGFYLSFDEYKSFMDLKKQFIMIINKLFETYHELSFKRIGLRYINTIEGKQKKKQPLDWGHLLNKKLLTSFEVPNETDKKRISRAFQVLELNYDDFNLRFQYGMHNPDYPAIIRQKIFTLDFDAYYNGLMTKDTDFVKRLTNFHDAIKTMIKRC